MGSKISRVQMRTRAKPVPLVTGLDLARLWARIQRGAPDECWPWLGGRTKEGYGRFKLAGALYCPHRLIYRLVHGVIPRIPTHYHGRVVLNSCDNPSCCNPNHLTLGTQQDNAKDMGRKGRTRGQRAIERRKSWAISWADEKEVSGPLTQTIVEQE